jgi:hypothetical protein
LDQDTRTVYILDPTPLDPIYQYIPNAKYVKKLLWLAEYLPKAISKACPGSKWNYYRNRALCRVPTAHDKGTKMHGTAFAVRIFPKRTAKGARLIFTR